MREIIFRGKRMDNEEWVYGWPFADTADCSLKKAGKCECPHDGSEYFIVEWVDDYHEYEERQVIPNTVGQYTGLKDKNSKRIFEDDVCRFREWSKGEMCWFGKVHFEHQQFMISGGPNKECETMFELCTSRFIPENIEVIGNIHDNPELLKEEAQQ